MRTLFKKILTNSDAMANFIMWALFLQGFVIGVLFQTLVHRMK